MKRMKKMLMMLIALVLCIGAYIGVQQFSVEQTVTEEAGTYPLTAQLKDDLVALQWTAGEENIHLKKGSDTWTVVGDAAFPLNQTEVQAMVTDLYNLQADRRLNDIGDLADYGLAEPAFTVTVTWADGTQTTYAMGDETPFGDGYYLSNGLEGVAYTVPDDLSDIFDTALIDLAVQETLPTVTDVTRITWGSLDITQREASLNPLADERWYADEEALQTDAVEALIDDLSNLTWASLVDPTADDLTAYQLNQTLTLYQDEQAVLTLLIGAEDENGDYYAALPGSAMVYTVSADDLASLMAAGDIASLYATALTDLTLDALQSMTFSTGSKAYIWNRPAESADATDETAAADESANERAQELWSAVAALAPTARLSEAPTGEVLLTVSLTTVDGVSATLTFRTYGVDAYTVSAGARTLLVSAAAVDKLIRMVR